MNGTAMHQWTIVYDASHRSYVEDKLSKNILDPYPHLDTLKDIASSVRLGVSTQCMSVSDRQTDRQNCCTALVHRLSFTFTKFTLKYSRLLISRL